MQVREELISMFTCRVDLSSLLLGPSRCACMGANGRRRVCVPPKAGWMCERKATLIKHDIILEREQEER